MACRLDHIVIRSDNLDRGAEHIGALLGQPLLAGGNHALMGTHNRLLRLGDVYLEVIAIDPNAARPPHPRWLGLDEAAAEGTLLCNWVLALDDLSDSATHGMKRYDLTRGDLRWQMALPPDGRPGLGGCAPAYLHWQGKTPITAMPDSGCRLLALELHHPSPDSVRQALPSSFSDPRVSIHRAEAPALRARIETPLGLRVIA